MSANTPKKSHKVPTYEKKDIALGILGAVVLLGLILYGIQSMFQSTENRALTGVIVEKEFFAHPETQITVGTAGVSQREVKGTFRLKVRVESRDRDFFVWVDEPTFNSHRVGGKYYFLKPPEGWDDAPAASAEE